MERLYTVEEAATLKGVTRQAIYFAIKQNKLESRKVGFKVQIAHSDLEDYQRNKYSRERSTHEGELVYDKANGYISVNQVSKLLDMDIQRVYYALRKGNLKSKKKRAAWVIHIDDVLEFKKAHLSLLFPWRRG